MRAAGIGTFGDKVQLLELAARNFSRRTRF
jgi:hypothetical protein